MKQLFYFGLSFLLIFGAVLFGQASYLDDKTLVVSDDDFVFKNGNVGISTANPLYEIEVAPQTRFNRGTTYDVPLVNANGATAIDWRLGNKRHVQMSGNTTFSFTAPSTSAALILVISYTAAVNDGTTVSWPNTIRWPQNNAPILTRNQNAVDIIGFYYEHTSGRYYGIPSYEFL